MKPKLKGLKDQVIVITGASSGIGRATARLAGERGAKVVAAARSEDALRSLVEQIAAAGGEAVSVVADVGNEADVRRIAERAVERFGGFDTWVNNAGISIYGRVDEVPLEDLRRLFDTNFWGVVHGSRGAAEHLRGRGGVIINIGSVVSDRAIPIQGMYSASKFAVKGFTDVLRMELEERGDPIYVTLIKPGSINTPFTRRAKNYMPREPNLPPPVYAPDVVARAILRCAERPERDVIVGGGGKQISSMETLAPRLTDKVMERTMVSLQQKDAPGRPRNAHALDKPSNDPHERGDYDGHVAETSAYTAARLHPLLAGALVLGAGAAVATFVKGTRERD